MMDLSGPPSLLAQSLYLTVLGLSLPIALLLTWVVFKRRKAPGAKPFLVFGVLAVEITVMYGMLALTKSPDAGFLTARLRFIGLAFAPVYFLLFAIEFTGGAKITRLQHTALLILPLVTQLLVWDVPGPNIFFAEWSFIQYELMATDVPRYASWFWVHTAYSNLLLLAGLLILLRFAVSFGRPHRQPIAVLSFGLGIMMFVGSARSFIDIPLNLTPVTAFMLMVLIAWVLIRQRVFDVFPVACEHIFQGMHDGVIVLNNRDDVVQINRAAEHILAIRQADIVRNPVNIQDIPLLRPWLDGPSEITVTANGSPQTYEVNTGVLHNTHGIKVGRFIMLRDITERKQAEEALRQSEQRYSHLLESVPSALAVLDLQTNDMVYMNPTARELFRQYGSSSKDAYRDWIQRHSPEQIQRIQASFQRNLEEGVLTPIEYTSQSENEPQRHIVVQPVPIEYNRQPALLISINDVTETRQVLEAEMEQRRFTEALLDMTAAVSSTLKLDEVIDRMFSALSVVVDFDWVNVMLLEGQEVHVIASQGYPDTIAAQIKDAHFTIDDTLTFKQMVESHDPIIIDDTTREMDWQHKVPGLGTRSYLGAPIVYGPDVIGFINLDSSRPNTFTASDATRVEAFASQMAVAILNAQLFERAQQDAATAERQRLARDLHDAVSQTLFSASVTAETLPHLLASDPATVQEGLAQLVKLTRGALSEMRTLLVELRPAALEETALDMLTTHLINSLKTRTTAEVHYTIEGTTRPIVTDVKIGLYRIVQEALNNVVKHSYAEQVDVCLRYNKIGVCLHVEDDGVGFDETLALASHFGLHIMRERAAALGIDLTIQSASGHGTVIDARWEEQTP